jgi:hypothetical protein
MAWPPQTSVGSLPLVRAGTDNFLSRKPEMMLASPGAKSPVVPLLELRQRGGSRVGQHP